MTFIFTLEGGPDGQNLVVPVTCHSDENARARAADFFQRFPTYQSIRVERAGKAILRQDRPAVLEI
ncbi:MAG: hypothetical protein JSR86_07925 [Proteobacteria bacterium]|nr:hypothetical protein [Pseudomonadota bacterium]